MAKAVIFDIDGTLLDSVDAHAEAWKIAFEHFGFSFPFPEIRYQIGKGGDKLLETFLTDEQIEQQGKQIESYRGNVFKAKFLPKLKPFPGVRELFQFIQDGKHKIALATSAKKDEAETYQKMLGIEGMADAVVTKDEVKESKPEPDVLQVARERLGGIAAVDCIFIGDTPHDAAAAKKDGMPIYGVLCGGFPEKDLREAGAKEIFSDPRDLMLHWRE